MNPEWNMFVSKAVQTDAGEKVQTRVYKKSAEIQSKILLLKSRQDLPTFLRKRKKGEG